MQRRNQVGSGRIAGLAGLVIAALLLAAPPSAFGKLLPQRINGALATQQDGCNPNFGLVSLGPKVAQSWTYVNRSRNWVKAVGPIKGVKISDEDLWAQHEINGQPWGSPSYFIHHDLNVDVQVLDESLLSTADPDDRLHTEAHTGEWAYQNQTSTWYDPMVWPWQSRTRLGGDYFPAFAWGMPNDLVVAYGPLVWDCAHVDSAGATYTELHPAKWWHVSHSQPVGHAFDPSQPKAFTPALEHSIYGNSNRQTSGMIAEYQQTCWEGACNDNARQDQLFTTFNNGVMRFFLAAPPKPAPGAQLRWDEVRKGPVTQMNNVGQVNVTPAGDRGVWVAINMTGQGGPQRDTGYAARWYVGWDVPKPGLGYTRIKTEFLRYWCLKDQDPVGAGEFQLQFAAGNDWSYGWDAGLNGCDDGSPQSQVVTLNPTPTFTTVVPNDQLLSIRLRGYENDDPIPGYAIADYDATWPLTSQTQIVNDPSPNGDYQVEIRTTVLP